MPSVSYEPLSGELRSVPAFFNTRLPDGLRWTVPGHQEIQPGMTMGFWHWEDGTESPIQAPAGCEGYLTHVNDRVSFTVIDLESQLLLVLQ